MSNSITAEELKQLEAKTSFVPPARPTLKVHEVPLKIRLVVNMQGSTSYRIAKLVEGIREKQTPMNRHFVQAKSIKLESAKNILSFNVEDMYPSLPKTEVRGVIVNKPTSFST